MAVFSTKTFTKNDDYYTPKHAWEAIKDFIPKDKIIWEAFYGDGKSGIYLQELGFNVIHKNEDFFTHNYGDIVVSNPPYSMKKEVLTRLKELDKPFIMIMPSSLINYKYFRDLFKDEKIQILIPKRRIQFEKSQNDKYIQINRCNFDCFYYCYKMDLLKDITFL